MMKAGKLRRRVTLQSVATSSNGVGGKTSAAPTTVATVWASVEPLSGGELLRAQQMQSNLSHRVTIRHRSGVTPRMRVAYQGRRFEIAAVIDPEERHERLVLLCSEVL